MSVFRIFSGIVLGCFLITASVSAKENAEKSAVSSKNQSSEPQDDFQKDWTSVKADTKKAEDKIKAAKAEEQDLRDQIQKAQKAGDQKKADQLREELKALHQEHMKEFSAEKAKSKDKTKGFLEDERKSLKPPVEHGKYLESRIEPGTDARNRHIDRRDPVKPSSYSDKRNKPRILSGKDEK